MIDTLEQRAPRQQTLEQRTESRRLAALAALDKDSQAKLGQFFTPHRAAELIAGLPQLPRGGTLRVLDPGAGAGSLAAAVVARVLVEAPGTHVEVVAVEVDPQVGPYLAATLADCEETARAQGETVRTHLVRGDFIELAASGIGSPPELAAPFDLVVMNPPYAKLGARSPHRTALSSQGVDCPNLYAAFLALGASALHDGGQIVAITPRSFANGPYFEQFRKFLLRTVAIDRLHTFESRSTVFADTGVLQENVVFSATRGAAPTRVVLSSSTGHKDAVTERNIPYSELVRPGDPHQFVRIAADHADTEVAELMASLPVTLPSLGAQVSTGRVVDFRSRECLRADADGDCVPLVYPGNLRGGVVEWSRAIRKPQGFAPRDDGDRKLLLPEGRYVVVKRFSSKEERRRIVAAVWDPDANRPGPVAFENHLNILHAGGAGLDRNLAVGLSLWLNSSLVDRYFRTFSGHTQVNATDLRALRYPPTAALRALGAATEASLPDQARVDELIAEHVLAKVAAA